MTGRKKKVRDRRPVVPGAPHPSGRPRHTETIRGLGFYRIPRDEPLIPGLRRPLLPNAIGFTVDFISSDDDE